MRAVGDNVVRLHPEVEIGGWLSVQAPTETRERIGKQVVSQLFGVRDGNTYTSRSERLLSAEQLWSVYQRVPDVRAAVDGVTRRVATWDWVVEPVVGSTEVNHLVAMETAAEATRFLQVPNDNFETWQELITKVVCDLLVFDVGVLEHVFDSTLTRDGAIVPGPNLMELTALRGANVHPVVDTFGKLKGYVQDPYFEGGTVVLLPEEGDQNQVLFAPKQITYLPLTPNTSTVDGAPLIEAIINEIVTLMRSSEHQMLAMDADEIPPGILVLTGLAGKAAEAAKADMQRLRGKDHKIRVVTNADPQATGAKWVELRRTAKDVDFVNVVREVRRTVWRVFGVLPVEMGATEDVPRAVGQVQLDVSASHLIGPLLELLENKVNARILPLVVGDPVRARLVKFRFDRDAKLTPGEQQQLAQGLSALVDRAIITRNEARTRLPWTQPIPGGSEATLTTGQGVLLLTDAVAGSVVPTTPQTMAASLPAPAPLRLLSGPFRRPHQHRDMSELPSEWQPEGLFAKVRTMDLGDLGDALRRYHSQTAGLWHEAQVEVLAVARSHWTVGGYTEDAAVQVARRMADALNTLGAKWRVATGDTYSRAAAVGKDAARTFSGAPVQEHWKARAGLYHDQAMGWLTQAGGLLPDLHARLLATVDALTMSDDSTRAASNTPPPGLDPADGLEAALSGFSSAFEANEFRIENWSGKLVELANTLMIDGVLEAGTVVATGPEVAGPVAAEWWCEWVAVGDARMCTTCTTQGAIGFQPLAALSVRPGGATECGARCRCVVVLWTKGEVDGGAAVKLGHQN